MKNTILLVALFVLGMAATAAKADNLTLSGDSQTKFGTYQLTPSSNYTVINDVAYKTWELTYSGSAEKYILFVVQGKDGNCCYNVKGDNFEVRYAVTSDGFGVRMVDPAFSSFSRKQLTKKLNIEQLQSQAVISSGQKSEEEYLGLIACFMPLLLN
ncbi:MAG TPA: hypothetical protein PKH79_04505 [Prolixibacteraceae bacterium]|nr:hypothetical protein [Prolixibacteraceae bacterium]